MAQSMSSVTVIDVSGPWASPPPPALLAWSRDESQPLWRREVCAVSNRGGAGS